SAKKKPSSSSGPHHIGANGVWLSWPCSSLSSRCRPSRLRFSSAEPGPNTLPTTRTPLGNNHAQHHADLRDQAGSHQDGADRQRAPGVATSTLRRDAAL